MKCECFSRIETKLKEKTGDPEAKIKAVMLFNEKGIEMRPVIPFTFRNKKRDGSFNKKIEESSITYSFCPWCGKKMD